MKEPTEPPSVRDHLANERTLLAWIRTSITVIGLGFLIDRFAVEGRAGGWEKLAGIGLVIFGAALALAGAYSYLTALRVRSSGNFRPAVALHLAVVAIVAIGGIVVAVLLMAT